jgi:sialidase-1
MTPIFALLVSLLASDDPPATAKILSEHLVVKDQGYFPVALRLKDGRIAAVLRGGAPHLGVKGRLDVVFSSDEGRTWSPPVVVNDSPTDDRNPAFGQAADGTLVVGFWRTARYDEKGKYVPNRRDLPTTTWATRSADGGKRWEEATEIDVADIGYGSPYGRIVTLPDGALLMPVYGEQPRQPGEEVKAKEDWSYLYRSTDHGKTWSRYSTVAAKRFNETSILRVKSGAMLAVLRSAAPEQAVWTSRSDDLGKSWSEPARVSPPMHHPGDLCELSDGRILLAVGDRSGDKGVVALVGDSTGRFDWSKHVPLVADATNTDCGYPSSVALEGGLALTLYYAVGRRSRPDWRTHAGAVIHRTP